MSLFQSNRKIKIDKKEIPLLTIDESLDIYGNSNAPTSDFGMDIFKTNFSHEGTVLLKIDGLDNSGIPFRCDYYTVILCLGGQTQTRQNHHRFQIPAQTAHLIQPGEIHSFRDTSADFQAYVLLFERAYLSKPDTPTEVLDTLLYADPDKPPKIRLSKEEFPQWLNLFNQLDFEIKGKDKYYHDIVRNQIIHLLYLIRRKRREASFGKNLSRQEQLYWDFTVLIETHFQHKKTVAEYAQAMNLTPKHLSETVKKVTTHTALYFIQERLIHESQYLLVYTSLNVKQIASKLNFDTPSHFVRFFKKQTEATPLHFRRNHSQQLGVM